MNTRRQKIGKHGKNKSGGMYPCGHPKTKTVAGILHYQPQPP
jgi:hypothetical protein